MRVVLDTNILLQSIGRTSRLRPIWIAMLNKTFNLYVTDAILLEYEEIISNKASVLAAQSIIALLSKALNVHLINTYYAWNAITKDVDDNKFFDAAIAANADYLVTNDRHFDEVKKLGFPKIDIISGDDFLSLVVKV